MAKFAQHFWGPDFCTTAGFDALVKRLKEGKRICHDFEDFLEKRVKIEREYGDGLIRLAEKLSGKEEIGSLRKSLEQIKAETDAIGKLHISLSQKIAEDILKGVREFRDQQRDTRKKSEDTVKRAASHKRQCYGIVNRTRSSYEQRCRDADKAEDAYTKQQSAQAPKQQELVKSQRRAEQARSSSKNADQLYQEAVKNLEESRNLWEREMELLCRQFQELEEHRISYLRHQLWTFCNMCSTNTVNEDQSYENVRQVLEECNVDSDIDVFVKNKATGTERPAPIPYVNFYNPSQNQEPAPRPARSEEHRKELPPIPPIPSGGPPVPPIPSGGPPVPLGGGDYDLAGGDGVYSCIPDQLKVDTAATLASSSEDSYYSTPRAFEKVKAVYSYEAQGSQELSLEEGAVISVVAKEDEVWWCGKLDGRTGMFPAAYVEPYDEQ